MACRRRMADRPGELLPPRRALSGWARAAQASVGTLGLLGIACLGPNAGISESPEGAPVQPPCVSPAAPTAYGSARINCSVLDSNRVPPARAGAALAYDVARQVLVLFGGSTPQVGFADTWEYDGTGWTQIQAPTTPSARSGHAMVYDESRHVVVLFGGFIANAVGQLGDTWEYDGATWTLAAPPASPPAQGLHRLAYDTNRKRTILFGGMQTRYPTLGATWEYDGATWTEISYTVGPSPRGDFGFAFDASRGRTVLHGGVGNDCAGRTETWVYDGGWTRLNVAAPTLTAHVLTYDPVRHDLMIVSQPDLWQFTGTSWLKMASDSPPDVGLDQAAVFDQARGELVVYYYTYASQTAATWRCRRVD
jgi:hypothetical protein